MRVTTASCSIQIDELTRADAPIARPDATVLGDPEYADRSYLLTSFRGQDEVIARWTVLTSPGYPEPGLYLEGNVILVGYQEELAWLDSESGAVLERLPLDSPFYFLLSAGESVIVVHEIGVLCIGPGIRVRWSFDSDIVSSASVHGVLLRLTFMDDDEPDVHLRLTDGLKA